MPTKLNVNNARDLLNAFKFRDLFVEELGWTRPSANRTDAFTVGESAFTRTPIAELSGIVVFEIQAQSGGIPDKASRLSVSRSVAAVALEHVLVFVDKHETQSVWHWTKREGGKKQPREHFYFKGQPGDLFLSKISSMVVDISELDEHGKLPLIDAAKKVKDALDVERVTKKFYNDFKDERLAFTDLIRNTDDGRDQRWYASVLLHRLMFVYFLQAKGFIDGGRIHYLQEHLAASNARFGADQYFERFLKPLFFEGFAKPPAERSPEASALLGSIRYLNGGLFLKHSLELKYPNISVCDLAFTNLFQLFGRYSWNLDDTPGGKDDELNPDVLGYIFEKYINQKEFGAYYTRPEITEYLCERTIHELILTKLQPNVDLAGMPATRRFESLPDLLLNLDARLCRLLLEVVLPGLNLLDPACGSGAFLVAAMKTLINVYSAVTGRIEYTNDAYLKDWLTRTRWEHKSLNYFIKRSIITNNLFGADIMEEACEIAKLRLFLALVSSAQSEEQLEPLPNIDFNILSGNSLIGLLHVDDLEFNRRHAQGSLFRESYAELVIEKNNLIRTYRNTASYTKDLQEIRDKITASKAKACSALGEMLEGEFRKLGVKIEEATWDDDDGKPGKTQKRMVTVEDIAALKPLHWGYEFDEILGLHGGFDAIITNPPWEILKPNAKEFFMEHSDLVTKNKMTIKEFEDKQAELLQNREVRMAWLTYQSQFPHQSAYFRNAPQYANQISVINGKRAGTDINLYKLFLEQCLNLLRPGGQCGAIVPAGMYTDLGTKQLRNILFATNEIEALYGLSNEKFIFESVHHGFKFCILVFRHGGKTDRLEAAFRINTREAVRGDQLSDFLRSSDSHVMIPIDLVRRLSPDSLSVMEFKGEIDIQMAEKMVKSPLLGEKKEGSWNLVLTNEFHMTNDSKLFRTEPGPDRLPLYEGKMIHQFTHTWSVPKYWVNEADGRKALCGRAGDVGQTLDYQGYRIAHRSIASSTNERTMIATVIPPRSFYSHSLNATHAIKNVSHSLFITAVLNSFTFDSFLRQKVTGNLTMFYIYQMPVPKPPDEDHVLRQIAFRTARLLCTTPEFDDLAHKASIGDHRAAAHHVVERAQLRAELDGLIAHLYGITEHEFAHILSTFPLVPDPVKVAAQNAYRDVERGLVK